MVADYELKDHHLSLLRLACESLDRVEVSRALVESAGMFTTDRFGCPMEIQRSRCCRGRSALTKSLLFITEIYSRSYGEAELLSVQAPSTDR